MGLCYSPDHYIAGISQFSYHSSMTNIIHVLLADDHAVVRAGIRQFLELAENITVVAEADEGETTKMLLKQYQPDVAVLDIQMPNGTGIEISRWIRQNYPEMGILILTSFDDDPYVAAALQAGANGFLLKTANPTEIVQAVQAVNAGKSHLDPSLTAKLFSRLSNPPDPSPVPQLSDREIEVLQLTSRGFTNKAIGVQLNISDRTVQGHLARIYAKLEVNSRTEAVMKAVSLGLISHVQP